MRTLLRFIQKYSNLLLFLLLEAIAITLIVRTSSFQRSKLVGLNRQVSGYVFSKVDGMREYFALKETNRKLALENTELRNRLDQYAVLVDSSRIVRELRSPYYYYYLPARIIHNSVFKQYNFITIDRGKKHGVYRDMGVISDQGLVGIVLESSGNFATVIPVINRDFRLSVKLKSTNYAGILQWDGSSPAEAVLTEIPFHVEVLENDTVLTSGFSAIFPEGIQVGTVESFTLDRGNFYDIRIRLSTDFQGLYHVNVIQNFRQQEQLDLEETLQ